MRHNPNCLNCGVEMMHILIDRDSTVDISGGEGGLVKCLKCGTKYDPDMLREEIYSLRLVVEEEEDI